MIPRARLVLALCAAFLLAPTLRAQSDPVPKGAPDAAPKPEASK